MKETKTGQEIQSNKRALLAMTSGIAGLATTKYWIKPVVEAAVLPAHATTTNPPVISNLRVTAATCSNGSGGIGRYVFNLEYDYSSLYGVVSHVITASCDAGDTMTVAAGNTDGVDLGDNLLGTTDSVTVTGDEFAGNVVTNNWIEGPPPQNCLLTLTLTDANGGQDSDSIPVSGNCPSV